MKEKFADEQRKRNEHKLRVLG